MDLKKLAWAACTEDEQVGEVEHPAPMHRWAHIKCPTTNKRSNKKWYVIASGGNLPWSLAMYSTWPDCHRYTSSAKGVLFMGFNDHRWAIRFFAEHNEGREPRLVPVGEDPFTPAHIWEQRLNQGEDPRTPKKQKADEPTPAAQADARNTCCNPPPPTDNSIDNSTHTSKQPREPDGSANGCISCLAGLTSADTVILKQTTEFLLTLAHEPTATLHITNLPRGVTLKVLYDVFIKYREIVGVHPFHNDEAVIQFQTMDAAKCARAANHGQTVADNHIGVTFANMFSPPSDPAPMNDDATVGGSTIFTKEDDLRPPTAPDGDNGAVGRSGFDTMHATSCPDTSVTAGAQGGVNATAICAVRALCPPDDLVQFKEKVAADNLVTTLLLFITREWDGSINTP